MRYKNTKTGAVFYSPCRISGGDWVLVTDEKPKTEEAIEEVAIVETPPEPKAEIMEESTADFDDITIVQIKQELDAFGIKYNPKFKKQELYDLMMAQGK